MKERRKKYIIPGNASETNCSSIFVSFNHHRHTHHLHSTVNFLIHFFKLHLHRTPILLPSSSSSSSTSSFSFSFCSSCIPAHVPPAFPSPPPPLFPPQCLPRFSYRFKINLLRVYNLLLNIETHKLETW